ncbi:MAG TPA: hypothetical protein QF720_05725 [Nitrospinota bacterium]|nr:hypothetical protein [Nitrospinota bacterium]|tara:strand:- start:6372 stop:6566 length:195 start_codon:yes stop_codon:yes gene_type:complete
MGIDYKLLRETAQMSEVEFANELKVTPELILGWETGLIEPSPIEKKKIFAIVKRIAETGQGIDD